MTTAARHVVVDGSNIATEGRSIPSLAQLESAVEELHRDLPDAEVTVVVDATFAHRIDRSELERFEKASSEGVYVSPPAGAIGRGDAFLLRIAEKVDGSVLSNDSFQEFHGEHPWLFEPGRLFGATPVPGVGWILMPRTPVRGPKSRVAVRDAERAKGRVERAIAVATAEATEDETTAASSGRRRRRGRGTSAVAPAVPEAAEAAKTRPQAVNEPAVFISFIAENPLGAEVEGVVDSFTSHGAVIQVGALRGYAPLSGLGSPAPRSAREVLRKGGSYRFAVTALDPYRRGVELALPGVGVVRGTPSEETVAAEVKLARPRRTAARKASGAPAGSTAERTSAAKKAPATKADSTKVATAPKKAAGSKVPAKSAPPSKRSAAKKASAPANKASAPAKKAVSPTKSAPVAKAAAKKTAATKAPATKAPARKAPARKVTAAAKKAARTEPAVASPTKAAAKKAVRTEPAVASPTKAAQKAASKKAGAPVVSARSRRSGSTS